MGRTGVAKKAEQYKVFGHPKAAKVAKGIMFELGVYFGARGVAKNGPLRPPRLKSMHFYVFSAPGGPKGRPRPKNGLGVVQNARFGTLFGGGSS